MIVDQRAPDPYRWEPGDYLAFLYTLGFLAMVAGVMYITIPDENSQIANTLVTIMSTIQIGIGKCYYDRAKADIAIQKSSAAQQAKSADTIQEIAKKATPTSELKPVTDLPVVPATPPTEEIK